MTNVAENVENLITVDIGVSEEGFPNIFNVENGNIILQSNKDNDILQLLMMLPENCRLSPRKVDYSDDDDFDAWLDESSIGEV